MLLLQLLEALSRLVQVTLKMHLVSTLTLDSLLGLCELHLKLHELLAAVLKGCLILTMLLLGLIKGTRQAVQLVLQLLLEVNLRRGLSFVLLGGLLILAVIVLLVAIIRIFSFHLGIFRSRLLRRLVGFLGQGAFDLVDLFLVMLNLLVALVKVVLQLGDGALLAIQLLLEHVNLGLLLMSLLFADMLVLHLTQLLLLLAHVLVKPNGRLLQLVHLTLQVLLSTERLLQLLLDDTQLLSILFLLSQLLSLLLFFLFFVEFLLLGLFLILLFTLVFQLDAVYFITETLLGFIERAR